MLESGIVEGVCRVTRGGRGDLKEAKRREATFRIAQKAQFTAPVKLGGGGKRNKHGLLL